MTDFQMSFEGRTIGSMKVLAPGLGLLDYSVPDGTQTSLAQGDRVRFVIEAVVDDVRFPERHNTSGVAIESMRRVHSLRAIVPDVLEIDAVARRSDLEAEWAERMERQVAEA